MKTASKNPLMIDVAREANVSRATVSYVINGRSQEEYIPLATQQKVKRACKKLGYRRNYLATAMVTQKTQVIGMLYPAANEFMGGFIRGAQSVLREYGLQTMICICDNNPEVEAEDVDIFKHRRVDGVIALPVFPTSKQSPWQKFIRDDRPIVFLDSLPDGIEGDCVGIDNFKVGLEAAEIFHREGVRHSVLVQVANNRRCHVRLQRQAGFIAGTQRLDMPKPIVVDGALSPSVERLLLESDCPTGVFAATTDPLVLFCKAFMERHKKINPNVLFAGCGLTRAPFLSPNRFWMTDYPAVEVGRTAGICMLQKLGHDVSRPASLTVPFKWHLNSMAELDLFVKRVTNELVEDKK